MQRRQQLAGLRGLVLLAAGLSAGNAAADTVFDFWAPGPEQEGDYVAADSAQLGLGLVTLELTGSPAWLVPDARWRIELRVASDLPRTAYPVRVDLSAAPDELFLGARGDGLDLRLFDAGGTELAVWIEDYDWISSTGALWFRPVDLAGGTNTFHCYFGDPEHATADDAGLLFRHDPPVDALWVVDDLTPTAPLAVAALDAGTRVRAGTINSTLAARELLSIPAGELLAGDALSVGGPVAVAGTVDGTDAAAPLAIASARLVGVAPRYADRFCLAAPFRPASIEIRSGTTSLTTTSLAAGETRCLDADVTDGSAAVLLADAPILAYHYDINAATNYDGYNMLAPSLELLGANTGTGRVVALEDGTTVRVYQDDGTVTTLSLAAGAGSALPGVGSQGSGSAVRLVADHPIAAIAYGDGDGGESIPFFPPALLGERFVVPLAAQYLLVAADQPGTECVLLAPDGTTADRQRGGTIAAPHPARLYFGTTGTGAPIAAGSELDCDGPVWAVFEDGTTQDEKTLWPVQVFRPVAVPEPTASFGALDTRHPVGPGTVTTPVYRPAWGVSVWLGFEEAGETHVPEGATLRYQLSVDGAATWLVPDTGGWRAAAAGEGAEPWQVDAAMTDLPDGTDELAVRALLGSEAGTAAPVLDDILVRVDELGEPSTITFGPIASPQRAGRPFVVMLTLVDADGLPVTGYTGTATLSASMGTVAPAESGPFSVGLASASVALDTVAAGLRLTARVGDAVGTSEPFDVVQGEVAALEAVSGDGQFGPAEQALAESLRVRAVDAEGNPVAAAAIVFAVTRGGGTVLPATTYTGVDGTAATSWTVGLGANVCEALIEGSPEIPAVPFAARGDGDEPPPVTDDTSGCGCRSTGAGPAGILSLLLLLVPALARRPRRRR